MKKKREVSSPPLSVFLLGHPRKKKSQPSQPEVVHGALPQAGLCFALARVVAENALALHHAGESAGGWLGTLQDRRN